jgi:hypothetical protein
LASVTVTVIENEPLDTVGVPEITPFANVKPLGNAPDSLHEIGVAPAEPTMLNEYDVSYVAVSPLVGVVTAGAATKTTVGWLEIWRLLADTSVAVMVTVCAVVSVTVVVNVPFASVVPELAASTALPVVESDTL